MRETFSTARVSGVSVTLNPSKVQRWVRLPADAFSFFFFFLFIFIKPRARIPSSFFFFFFSIDTYDLFLGQ